MVYNKNKARTIAQELLGSDARTAEDINEITKSLKKMFIETALEAELEEHLGYEKGEMRPQWLWKQASYHRRWQL